MSIYPQYTGCFEKFSTNFFRFWIEFRTSSFIGNGKSYHYTALIFIKIPVFQIYVSHNIHISFVLTASVQNFQSPLMSKIVKIASTFSLSPRSRCIKNYVKKLGIMTWKNLVQDKITSGTLCNLLLNYFKTKYLVIYVNFVIYVNYVKYLCNETWAWQLFPSMDEQSEVSS